MKFVSVYETDKKLLEAIDIIHLNGRGFHLDPTYSKGVFYKKQGFKEPRLKADLKPLYPDVKKADCRDSFNYKENSIESIIFDPPFLFRNRKAVNNDKMCNRFSYFKTFEELKDMYQRSLFCFQSILVPRGILVFKCQDMTDGSGSRPFFDTHCEVISMARKAGFSLRDIGILVRKRKIIRKAKTQGCLRKIHSYYLVFRKERF